MEKKLIDKHHTSSNSEQFTNWDDYRESSQLINSNNINQKNHNYNPCKAWAYALIHAIGGFTYGYAMTCMNNLARPVIEGGLEITGDAYVSLNASQTLCFGIGKVIFSFLGGLLADSLGRRNQLIFAELLNVISIVLMIMPNEWCLQIGRFQSGAYLGYVTLLGPRMVNECFPVNKRGITVGIFSYALSFGVCFSFSLGKIFGDSQITYWKLLLTIPQGVCFLRMCVILIFYNHRTPKQVIISNKNYIDQDDNQNIREAENIMLKYYDNIHDVDLALNDQKKIGQQMNEQKGFFKLFKENLGNRKTMYSTMACFAFNVYPNQAGQPFCDNFSADAFTKQGMEEFGKNVNFYCGFVVLAACTLSFFQLDKLGRAQITVIGSVLQIISMWIQTFSFYYRLPWISFIGFALCDFAIYFGNQGIYYVYVNELSEPFVVGIGLALLWITKTTVGTLLPYLYNAFPLYWCTVVMTILGTIVFVIVRPLYLETTGKSALQIKKEYSEMRYNVQSR